MFNHFDHHHHQLLDRQRHQEGIVHHRRRTLSHSPHSPALSMSRGVVVVVIVLMVCIFIQFMQIEINREFGTEKDLQGRKPATPGCRKLEV